MSREKTKKCGTTNPAKVVTVATVLIILFILDVTAKYTTRVESFRSCAKKNGANIGNFVSNTTIHKSKYRGVVEGEINVLKTMKPPLPADITISRCRNSAGKECVSLLKYKHNNICAFLITGSSNDLWKDFVNKIVPPLDCPVKKGEYIVQNGTFDDEKFASYFQAVPGEQPKVTYYILKVYSKVKDEDMICMEITFRQVRS